MELRRFLPILTIAFSLAGFAWAGAASTPVAGNSQTAASATQSTTTVPAGSAASNLPGSAATAVGMMPASSNITLPTGSPQPYAQQYTQPYTQPTAQPYAQPYPQPAAQPYAQPLPLDAALASRVGKPGANLIPFAIDTRLPPLIDSLPAPIPVAPAEGGGAPLPMLLPPSAPARAP